jgi:hypothetical protein
MPEPTSPSCHIDVDQICHYYEKDLEALLIAD